jgi:zinc D-Ala-D-Ala carboxypeptidase
VVVGVLVDAGGGVNLSPNFTYTEMTTTSTGLQNLPDASALLNLRLLCHAVLEPLRSLLGPLKVNSGFRSLAVNAKVGGAAASQHRLGQACDFVPLHMAYEKAWAHIVDVSDVLPVDQAIAYVQPPGEGWFHVSHSPGRAPRRQLLVKHASGYTPWAEWGDAPLVLP